MSGELYDKSGNIIYQLSQPKEERWKAHIIDLSQPIPPPEPLLVQRSSQAGLLYKRGIHITSGKQKAGKTFYNSILVSALLREEGYFGLQPTKPNMKVLFVDTEQDVSDTQEVIRRIHRLNDWPTDKNISTLTGANLRELMASERIEIVEDAIKALKPDVTFIDGVVDLCLDFNDLSEAHSVTTMLMKWASKYDTAIVTALHVNKGDDNLRGHLGTFLAQKGESVIRITKEDDGNPYMMAKIADSRHQPIDDFYFRIEDGLPVPYQPLGTDVKSTVSTMEIMDYERLFEGLMGSLTVKNKDLLAMLSKETGKSMESCKKYIAEGKSRGLLTASEGGYEFRSSLPF